MPHREGEGGGRRRFGTTMVMGQDGGGVGGPAEGAGGEGRTVCPTNLAQDDGRDDQGEQGRGGK